MQALSRVTPQIGAPRGLIVPGLVAGTALDGRPDVDEPRMVASRLDHCGHHFLFTDVFFCHEVNLYATVLSQGLRVQAAALTQRFDKLRVVEDADAFGVQEARHAFGIRNPRQCAHDEDSVVAGQDAAHALGVAFG